MRIAMLGHKTIPSREGGVEVVVTELAIRMAALGHEVTVFNRCGYSVAGAKYNAAASSGAFADYQGVRIKTVPTVKAKGFAAASSSFFAMRAAIAARPDIIHVHAEGPAAMCGMARRAGIPCVVTVHGLDWQRAKWGGVGKRYILHGEREAVNSADEIIVLSENARSYFKNKYDRDTVFIPNGIDAKTPLAASAITKEFGLERNGFILYLGRIVPEKGIHYLIDAFSRTPTDKKLVIAGGPSDSQDYFNRIKEQGAKDSRIIFTGFVRGRMLEEFNSNAYIYVLPSDIEGMPMSLLEAMAYGNCCLVSDIPENVSVIGECGVAFEHGSPVSLAAFLSALIEYPQAVEQFRRSSKKRVINAYSWNETVKQTLEVYKRVLMGRN